MPKVQFYHDAADPGGLACELAARAHASGRRVALRLDDPDEARRIDRMLWNFEQLAFVPHVAADSPLAAETPVVIGHAGQRGWPHQDVLINLAADLAPDFDAFRMVVEIVGQSEASKVPGRERFRHYRQHNLPIQRFDAMRREAL